MHMEPLKTRYLYINIEPWLTSKIRINGTNMFEYGLTPLYIDRLNLTGYSYQCVIFDKEHMEKEIRSEATKVSRLPGNIINEHVECTETIKTLNMCNTLKLSPSYSLILRQINHCTLIVWHCKWRKLFNLYNAKCRIYPKP